MNFGLQFHPFTWPGGRAGDRSQPSPVAGPRRAAASLAR
jgi:hypothetical protein